MKLLRFVSLSAPRPRLFLSLQNQTKQQTTTQTKNPKFVGFATLLVSHAFGVFEAQTWEHKSYRHVAGVSDAQEGK